MPVLPVPLPPIENPDVAGDESWLPVPVLPVGLASIEHARHCRAEPVVRPDPVLPVGLPQFQHAPTLPSADAAVSPCRWCRSELARISTPALPPTSWLPLNRVLPVGLAQLGIADVAARDLVAARRQLPVGLARLKHADVGRVQARCSPVPVLPVGAAER